MPRGECALPLLEYQIHFTEQLLYIPASHEQIRLIYGILYLII